MTRVRESKAFSVEDLLQWVTRWERDATAALESDDPQVAEIRDTADVLRELSAGLESVSQVADRLEALFTDTGESQVVFSSVHKAKGLECDVVHLFVDTFKVGRSIEEDNLFYVAVTRSKRDLWLLRGTP